MLVANGVVNRELNRLAGKHWQSTSDIPAQTRIQTKSSLPTSSSGLPIPATPWKQETIVNPETLTFVYPFGSSLHVAKPAVPILSSGNVSFPLNQPVAAFTRSQSGRGKIIVCGSSLMFSDEYLDKEENKKLLEVLLLLLTSDQAQLNAIDAEDPDVS